MFIQQGLHLKKPRLDATTPLPRSPSFVPSYYPSYRPH